MVTDDTVDTSELLRYSGEATQAELRGTISSLRRWLLVDLHWQTSTGI